MLVFDHQRVYLPHLESGSSSKDLIVPQHDDRTSEANLSAASDVEGRRSPGLRISKAADLTRVPL